MRARIVDTKYWYNCGDHSNPLRVAEAHAVNMEETSTVYIEIEGRGTFVVLVSPYTAYDYEAYEAHGKAGLPTTTTIPLDPDENPES